MEFFGNSIRVLCGFLGNSYGILREFLGNSLGILWGSFWMYGWGVLNVWVLILGNLTSSEDLKGKTRTKTITRSAELECSRLKIILFSRFSYVFLV